MTTVSLVEDITANVVELPLELQREVLHFIQFLSFKLNNGGAAQSFDVTPEGIVAARRAAQIEENAKKPKSPIRNIIGMFDHLGVNITEEDMAEARHEMWGNFPREEPR
jgi:hypothetical protein